jgi:hypothetical protein
MGIMAVTGVPPRFLCVAACLAVLSGRSAGAQPGAGPAPLLVVLADTGEMRDGLHVFRPHPRGSAIASELLRGFPARLVRMYRMQQAYLHRATGAGVEPAYLEFSTRQGGFPGFGFWLGGEAKRGAGYVDLYEQRHARPRFGGIDQIFPHELAHVMLRQLAGEPPRGAPTQGHAIGVRTDPIVAFDEGFAESFQVMALDDPDGDPRTRALAVDPYWRLRAEDDARAYREAMTARWAPACRARIGFPFWFSGDEQVWRYHAVKANAFARQVQVPERLLRGGDPYGAYLLENTLPAGPSDPPKTAAQMLATEGVVSTLFWRWATSEGLRHRYRDEAFYESFGAARAEVPPEANVYLKLFHAFHAARPHTAADAIAAYRAAFPEDAAEVDGLVREVLLGHSPRPAPEIWLANPAFQVGTRVFDQFRASPRVHTFDLNAASLTDLVAVPGVDLDLARRILRHAPYASIADVARVAGVSDDLRLRFAAMADGIEAARSAPEGANSLVGLLWSFGRRALAAWLVAAVAAAVLFKRIRRCGWTRAAFSGLGASAAAMLAAWMTGSLALTIGVPLLLFAVPGLLWSLRRRPVGAALAATALGWSIAILPALLLVTPLF